MDDITPPKKSFTRPSSPSNKVNEQPAGAPELAGDQSDREVTSDVDLTDIASQSPADKQKLQDSDQDDPLVTEIERQDADAALAKQDFQAEQAVVMKPKLRERLKAGLQNWWDNPKKRWPVLFILLVIIVVFALPQTRYRVLGLVIKKPVQLTVLDSKTGTPVSRATISYGNNKVLTDAKGMARLNLPLGSHELTTVKQYYTTGKTPVMVGFNAPQQRIKLVATGRQVPVTVINRITGKPVADATLAVAKTQAKTDKSGKATIVLPTTETTLQADISANGYLNTKLPISVTSDVVAANTLSLTPSGQVYFLSNSSGKLDVVKTNLDGTNRQTVLAGTGNEDQRNTSLLASRDWKYLALLSKRSGNSASVYLIDTTNGDKLTGIDSGSASFSLVGWDGDTFVYQTTRSNVASWQPGQTALKSYDPTAGKLYQLDQTTASGTSADDYIGQSLFSSYIVGSTVVYGLGWNASFNNYSQLSQKQTSLMSINADGSGKKTVKSFTPDPNAQVSYLGFDVRSYEPASLYIQFTSGGDTELYEYENGAVNPTTDVTADSFYDKAYPTYLQSPGGKSTFWSEQRDGKNTLFVGDANGQNGKQIMNLSEYKPYGWYTDSYLLVSKNSSELYILPADGSKPPQKISNYFKPDQTYLGYGGGYGGL